MSIGEHIPDSADSRRLLCLFQDFIEFGLHVRSCNRLPVCSGDVIRVQNGYLKHR